MLTKLPKWGQHTASNPTIGCNMQPGIRSCLQHVAFAPGVYVPYCLSFQSEVQHIASPSLDGGNTLPLRGVTYCLSSKNGQSCTLKCDAVWCPCCLNYSLMCHASSQLLLPVPWLCVQLTTHGSLNGCVGNNHKKEPRKLT